MAALGPGSIALENVLGWEWAGLWWAIAAAAVGTLAGLAAVGLGRVRRRTRGRQPLAQAA